MTNGVDLLASGSSSECWVSVNERKQPRAVIFDSAPSSAVGLPPQYQPKLPPTAGSEAVIKSYILPDNKTGVVCPLHFLLT